MNVRKTLAAICALGLALIVGASEASAQIRPTTTPPKNLHLQPIYNSNMYQQYQRPFGGGAPITVPSVNSNINVYQNSTGRTVWGGSTFNPGAGWQKLTPVRR